MNEETGESSFAFPTCKGVLVVMSSPTQLTYSFCHTSKYEQRQKGSLKAEKSPWMKRGRRGGKTGKAAAWPKVRVNRLMCLFARPSSDNRCV